MNYRTLGMTGLKVSEMGLGAFPIAGLWQRSDGSRFGWTGMDDGESIALIHRAEELGVNLIDTAEGYGDGHSEEVTGSGKNDELSRLRLGNNRMPTVEPEQFTNPWVQTERCLCHTLFVRADRLSHFRAWHSGATHAKLLAWVVCGSSIS